MRTKSLLPIDELNRLNGYLEEIIGNAPPGSHDADAILPINKTTLSKREEDALLPKVLDSILDILVMGYVLGGEATNIDLDTDIKPDALKMDLSIFKHIEDKTWEDRVKEHLKKRDVESIKRVVDTETHRVYNDGQIDTAIATNLNVKKTWITMLDNKVRDTHDFLEGVSVGLEERFYTFDGDSALAPGGFSLPQNNVNCRCELSMTRA